MMVLLQLITYICIIYEERPFSTRWLCVDLPERSGDSCKVLINIVFRPSHGPHIQKYTRIQIITHQLIQHLLLLQTIHLPQGNALNHRGQNLRRNLLAQRCVFREA